MKHIFENIVEYVLAVVLLFIVAIVVLVVSSSLLTNPLDVYEQAYSECMARETIGHDECHDLAVRAAYPNRSTTYSFNNP